MKKSPPDRTGVLTVYHYDDELNVVAAQPFVIGEAVLLLLELAGELTAVTEMELIAHGDGARGNAAALTEAAASLWRHETLLETVLIAGDRRFSLYFRRELDGSDVILGSDDAIFGARYDDIQRFLRAFAQREHVIVQAPLQLIAWDSDGAPQPLPIR